MTTNLEMSAYEYGKMAFEKGIKRVPVLDRDFIHNCLVGCKVGEGIEPLKQWTKGWDDANLADHNTLNEGNDANE